MKTAQEVWDNALSDPGFRAALDEGLADLAAGRVHAMTEPRLDPKAPEPKSDEPEPLPDDEPVPVEEE